jgi:hypothetical protein
MSLSTHSQPRRPLVLTGVLLIGLAASAAATHAQGTLTERAMLNRIHAAMCHKVAVEDNHAKSAYFAEFTGVGTEGRDMVWHGAAAGASIGEVTVRLAHVGRDVDTANPTWPVEGIIFISGEDPSRAFAAEVHGTIDWQTKRVSLAGDVSLGYMRGAHVEQMADLVDYNLSGELQLTQATLAFAR